jgi:NifB/MoaA-like Fe-S oxidoreductase
MHLEINHEKQAYAHVVVMPHANRNVLTEFLTDLDKDATPDSAGRMPTLFRTIF